MRDAGLASTSSGSETEAGGGEEPWEGEPDPDEDSEQPVKRLRRHLHAEERIREGAELQGAASECEEEGPDPGDGGRQPEIVPFDYSAARAAAPGLDLSLDSHNGRGRGESLETDAPRAFMLIHHSERH